MADKPVGAASSGLRSIAFKQRAGDVCAHLNGDRAMWGAGRNEHEALGNALLAHAEALGIEIERPGRG